MTDICAHSCPRCGKNLPGKGQLGQHKRWCGTQLAVDSFWAKVDKSAGEQGCWLYTGFKKWDGYGWLCRGRWMTAHRYSWILAYGEPPEGMSIMHKCDNPPCCNPAHLELGTHVDNMADMRRKNRNNSGYLKKTKPVLHPDRVRPRRTA